MAASGTRDNELSKSIQLVIGWSKRPVGCYHSPVWGGHSWYANTRSTCWLPGARTFQSSNTLSIMKCLEWTKLKMNAWSHDPSPNLAKQKSAHVHSGASFVVLFQVYLDPSDSGLNFKTSIPFIRVSWLFLASIRELGFKNGKIRCFFFRLSHRSALKVLR